MTLPNYCDHDPELVTTDAVVAGRLKIVQSIVLSVDFSNLRIQSVNDDANSMLPGVYHVIRDLVSHSSQSCRSHTDPSQETRGPELQVQGGTAPTSIASLQYRIPNFLECGG